VACQSHYPSCMPPSSIPFVCPLLTHPPRCSHPPPPKITHRVSSVSNPKSHSPFHLHPLRTSISPSSKLHRITSQLPNNQIQSPTPTPSPTPSPSPSASPSPSPLSPLKQLYRNLERIPSFTLPELPFLSFTGPSALEESYILYHPSINHPPTTSPHLDRTTPS